SGADVQLSVCDNATTAEGSVACANRFVDEGVLAVLGPISTTHAIPAAEVLQQAGIIMISTASTNPATTQVGDKIFRMSYTDDFQGKVAARYAVNDLGATSAIVFRQQDDDYSFGLANFFDEEFQLLGGSTVVVDYVATPSTSPLRSTTSSVRQPTSSTSPVSALKAPRWCRLCAQPDSTSRSSVLTHPTTRSAQ